MSEKWIQVSPEQARQHRLYGIKGWLLLFLVCSLFGLLAYLSLTVGAIASAKLDWATLFRVTPNAANFILLSGVLTFATTLAIFVLALQKHKSFRVVSIGIMVLLFPAVATLALLFPFVGSVSAVLQSILPWLVSCAVWGSYLQLSRRVRVTFENTVRSDELVQNGVTASKQYSRASSSTPSGDDWASALAEYESDDRQKGLWAKLYAENNGDEAKTKASYLSIRATEFFDARSAESRLAVQPKKSRRHKDILFSDVLVGFVFLMIVVAALLKKFQVI